MGLGKAVGKAAWGTMKFAGRLGEETVYQTAKRVPGAVNGSLHYLSGIDKTFFNRGEMSLSNILGRTPKPWLMGSLAFGAIVAGSGAGEDMYQQAVSGPETQIPSMEYEGQSNTPIDMNTMGLVQALHKNRHG
jgi:hypothetical protein